MATDIGGLPAITLLLFLNTHNGGLEKGDFLQRLNEVTANILTDSYDSGLHNLIDNNGWDESTNSFITSELNVDTLTRSLRLLTQRRKDKASKTRASLVDVKNIIQSFAPDLLMRHTRDRYADVVGNKLEPLSVYFNGVCLLADISGFTRLSGKFCEGGKDGIDQLQQVVNGYLGQLVKIVYAYGGDVMKFAGDALVCVFQPSRYDGAGKELSIADTCSNAAQCASELTQICTEQLTIHVAISCGPICFAMLGGHDNIWECLVSGSCLGDLSQCLDDASSKQTVVSPQFVKKLGPNYRKELDVEQLSSGNYRLISAVQIYSLVVSKMIKRRGEMLMKDSESRFTMFPNDDQFLSMIRLFVPMPVTVGLVSGTFDYLAELREVTTMFMSWDSYDMEKHMDLLSLQVYFLAAQKVLSESGGFIRQFLIDDKGCVLIACWGVPTASHPDNTRRALCAGAIIGQKLNELGMETSVGITTGNVFCGSVGSYVRREYAVIGDVVNLAARLMSKAKGGLYIDEATYARIPQFLQGCLQELAPMALKGKDLPIKAYCLKKGVSNISLDDQGEKEINVGFLSIRPVCKEPLLIGLRRISADRPVRLKCILLEGKKDTGKMEVVNWLKLTGPKMDIRVVCVSLSPNDMTSGYSLLARLFRLLIREAIFDDHDSRKSVIRQILKHIYKSDVETIDKVAFPTLQIALGIKSSTTKKLPKKIVKECLLAIFTYLLKGFPVVVVIEHAHMADNLSWEVILDLIGVTSFGLLVMTMEPLGDFIPFVSTSITESVDNMDNHPSDATLARLSHHYKILVQFKLTSVLMMNDYSVLDVGQLLCSVLELEVCTEQLASCVHRLAGGDPFWCREMALFIQIIGVEVFVKVMSQCCSFIGGTPSNIAHAHSRIEGERPLSRCNTSSCNSSSLSLPALAPYTARGTLGSGKSLLNHVSNKIFGTLYLEQEAEEPQDDDGTWAARKDIQAKLQLFIVCRLETISREDQNILRTASIIGCNFSQVILYGILSPKMRTQMFSSLQSLVRSRWLLEKVSLIAGDSTDYSFVHPFFYRALYDLTPAGDKAILHYAVATFIEEAHYHSPVHFAQLGRHFGLAKDCRPKALEYYVRAASHSFNFGPLACDEGLGLLSQARMYADSALDYGTLLGLVIYRTQRLKSAMEILALRPPHNPLHSSTIPSSNWSFLNIRTSSRSNRVASLPVTTKLTEQEVEAASADRFLLLLAKMEVDLERLYGEMVRRNCVGVVSEWQRPYLVRWKAATELDISAPIVRPLHDQFEKSKDGLSSFRSWMSQLTVGPSRVDIDPDNSIRLSNPAVYGESGFSSDGDTPLEVSSSYTPLADIRPISDRPATVYSRSI